MSIFGLPLIDWGVIAVYLLGISFLGMSAVRKVKSSASYFIGDRKFGKAMMIFFTFGTGTHSDHAVSVVSKTYHVGASGIWYQWLWLLITPFYWLIAPVYRRMRAVTTADYYEVRYSRSVSGLYAVLGMLSQMVAMGLMLKGSGELVAAISNQAIPANAAIAGMTVLFLIYGIAGGMNAAIVTDFVQGMLTIVLSFLIVPFALDAVGGIGGLKAKFTDPHMLEIVAPGVPVFYVAMLAINGLVGWVTLPQSMGMCAAGKTEMEGRIGVAGGSFIKRVCTVAWLITGLCGAALYAGQKVNPDHIYGFMARDLLPKIAPGLIGVMIASMLASVMSTCDTFMVTSAGLFTRNLYRPLFAPRRDDRHYMLVGRISSALIVILGIAFALGVEDVLSALKIFWKVTPIMGIAFWAGLFWRRATVAGAWASTLVTFAVMLFTGKIAVLGVTLWDFARFAESLPAFMVREGRLFLPWQMVFYLSAGLCAMIVVSLLTRRVPAQRLDRMYRCLRTPIQPGEPETAPFTLPEGVRPAPRNDLINHPDFEIPKMGPVAAVGFAICLLIVVVLIASVFLIFSL